MGGRLLETCGVSIRFGGICAVSDFNCHADKGEIVGIIGPNGAGKTTLFNMLTGIYRPTSGAIFFKGVDIGKMKPHEITEMGMSRTFQNIRLFDRMTVLDNVMTGLHCRTRAGILGALLMTRRHREDEARYEARAVDLLELTGLADYRYEYADSLAYGLQRKLEIARAMAADPDVLLLDEPAAGMNDVETAELTEFIREVNRMGYTIVFIEHNVRLVMELSSRIYVLDHGLLLSEGTPRDIRRDPKVIDAYLGREVD